MRIMLADNNSTIENDLEIFERFACQEIRLLQELRKKLFHKSKSNWTYKKIIKTEHCGAGAEWKLRKWQWKNKSETT